MGARASAGGVERRPTDDPGAAPTVALTRLGLLRWAWIHSAQGSTCDITRSVIPAERARRDVVYVAMTRGRGENHVYVPTSQPEEVLLPPPRLDTREQMLWSLASLPLDGAAVYDITPG